MTNNELLSASLLDILFDGRNKEYGAYALRRGYNRRLYTALGIGLSVLSLFVGINALRNENDRSVFVPFIGEGVTIMPYEIPDETKKPDPPKPLPQPVKPAALAVVDYTTIKVVPDEEVEKPVSTQAEMDGKQIADQDKDGDEYTNAAQPGPPVPAGNGNTEQTIAVPPVYHLPEQANPEYPGGYDALLKFLSRNLGTPDELESGEKKMVKARFRVDTDGTVSLVEIEQSGGNVFDREVIRVCKKMPKWKPAIQNGVPVAVSYVLPVTFIGVEQ